MRTSLPILILAIALAACGGTTTPSGGASGSPGGASTQAPATGAPSTDAPAESDAPVTDTPSEEPAVETDEPGETEAPTAEATDTPATPETSGEPDPAAACSGSDANRSFFADAAEAVEWPVLCAVLPKGWFVTEGSYRKAGGGKLEIAYRGPGGVSVSLSEGAFCSADDGCVPPGGDLGEAELGPLGGTLVGLDDAGLAIVVDRGLNPSWLMVAHGLDQPTVLALASAMVEVAD